MLIFPTFSSLSVCYFLKEEGFGELLDFPLKCLGSPWSMKAPFVHGSFPLEALDLRARAGGPSPPPPQVLSMFKPSVLS